MQILVSKNRARFFLSFESTILFYLLYVYLIILFLLCFALYTMPGYVFPAILCQIYNTHKFCRSLFTTFTYLGWDIVGCLPGLMH